MRMHVLEPGGGHASAGGVRARALAGGRCAVEADLQTREVSVQAPASGDLLASSTGMPAPQIAAVVRSDESHVRKVIHAFNERGFASLDPDYRGGRPRKTTPAARPDRLGRARPPRHPGRGVDALVAAQAPHHLAGMGIVLSEEALRRTLIGAGLSHQRTRSWKWSPDPEFQAKAERVLGLYATAPRTALLCVSMRWARSS